MRRPFFSLRSFGLALPAILAAFAPALVRGDDSSSMARYIPKDQLVFYVEYQGLDAHADAWRKSSAYKILNDTPTGAMLEELFLQSFTKVPQAKVSGAEVLGVIKHMARSGFVFAMGGDTKKAKPDFVVWVFRDAYKNKEVRPMFSRMMAAQLAPNSKLQAVTRAGHKIASGQNVIGNTFSFWNEESKKEDIILVGPNPQSADIILETMDGKKPNALEHPFRRDAFKEEGGFEPNGLAFLDATDENVIKEMKAPASLGLTGIKRVDIRWGFQGDALMSVTRIVAPSPRKGVLAMFDGPSFDKTAMPPMPDSLPGFTVFAFNAKDTWTKALELAKQVYPKAEDSFNQATDWVKAKTKLRLKEDVLTHFGPRAAAYVLPVKASTAVGTMPLTWTMALAPMGLKQIPKAALVIEIDDPVAVAKMLDEVMSAVNREFKASAAKAAGGGEPAQPKAGRGRTPSAATYEFKLMPGDVKTYVLNVPQDLAATLPSTVRPAIRVGAKYLAIGLNAETARMALEAKGSSGPTSEVSSTFALLSSKLKYLNVSDPRDTTPEVIASLPGKLQTAINATLMSALPPTTVMPPGSSPPAGSPPARVMPGTSLAGIGGAGPGGAPATPPPAPGAAAGGAKPTTFVYQIDAAKLPSASSIKALMFPTVMAAEVDDEGLKIVTRAAFIEIPDPSAFATGYQMGKGMMPGAGLGGMPMPGGISPPPGLTPPPGGLPAPGGVQPGSKPKPGGGRGVNPL